MTSEISFQTPAPGIVHLIIQRESKLNALSCEAADELRELLIRAEADEANHVVVIRGAGKAFSTGLDLSGLDPENDINLGDVLKNHFEPLLQTIRDLQIPVVSAVNGPTAGVSAGLALTCDLSIATESAYFLLPFSNLGLVPDGGLTWLLPHLAGMQRAMAASMLAEPIPAQAAKDWGLIWKCVPDSEFDSAVDQCAKRLAQLPRSSLGAIKNVLHRAASNTYQAQILLEREVQHSLGSTEEFRARLIKFLRRQSK